MAYDIGPRIGIDGEAEFRQQLQSVSTSLKTLESEMKAVTSAFIGNEDTMEALTAQNDVLAKSIDAQREKLAKQQEMLEKSRDKYGDNADATMKWQRAVNESTAQLNKMQAQLNSNNERIEAMANAGENAADEMANLDQKLRTLGSELRMVRSSMDAGEDGEKSLARQAKILNEQIETQEKKIEQLRKELDRASKEFGEGSTKTLRYRQAVNDATTELNQMKRALQDVEDGVEDINDATGEANFSFKGLSQNLSLGLKAGAVIAVVKGLKELSDKIVEVVEETREYRTIMASLETSSQRAGYTAEQTSEAFTTLFSVLGDTQTAATTTANLQAIGFEQEQLLEIIDAVIGAWATYGDSIPIDGLAEAINETIKVGQVTGTFADVLNWAGTSEDEFNEKLAATNDLAERASLVMAELARQGLAEAGEAWRQNNQDITAVNEAQARYDAALAEMGAALAPVAAAIKNFSAGALSVLAVMINSVVTALDNMIQRLRAPELRDLMIKGFNAGINGSFATGLNYVPYDGFVAELHKGEMVLTARQAEMMRSTGVTNGSMQNTGAALINAMQTMGSGSFGDTPINISLMLPDGDALATWQLPSLLRVANAQGITLVAE